MPKRPRQHILQDLARADLRRAFSGVGWSVEDLAQDYGEDLLVRIFEDGKATPWAFFVQSKATDRIRDFCTRDGRTVAYPVGSEHARHWVQFWEPVVLAVYDAKSDTTYWEIIQDHIQRKYGTSASFAHKTMTVHVPMDNRLDAEGFRRLRNKTKRRFNRFGTQKEGAELLIRELQKQWGVQIEYEPEGGYLRLPKGRFQPDPSGEATISMFGRLGAKFATVAARFGMDPQRLLTDSIDLFAQALDAYQRDGKLVVRNRAGSNEFRTLAEFNRYLDRLSELHDP